MEKNIESRIEELKIFRRNMDQDLSISKCKYIWGISKEGLQREYENELVTKKSLIAKKNIGSLLLFDWVKFIGISGSIAAGFVKEEDDIDVFIVVKNNTAWLYRGLISLRNIFTGHIRTKRSKSVKDLFCTNYIVEERGLQMKSDIFNFHELMYLIPLYNPSYIHCVYSKNPWLRNDFFVSENLCKSDIKESSSNYVLTLLNKAAFQLQIYFMMFANHTPELDRLEENYEHGCIQFFPRSFKQAVLKGFR